MSATQPTCAAGAVRRPSAASATHMHRVALLSLWLLSGCDATDVVPDAAADAQAEAEVKRDASGNGDAGDDAGARETEALTNNALWLRVEADDDPFDDAPGSVQCPDDGFGSEPLGGLLTFYVDSGRCHYLTVSQPSRAAVRQGDVVNVRFKHFPLAGPDGGTAEAHLAFMLGDVPLAERNVAIPAEDMEYEVTWTATKAIDEGTPVYFHAHNHGQNEYSVLSIVVVPGE